MKHKIHACLASQLKTLTQDQVEGALSMSLVEITVLCLAQSMLEEHMFPFQQTNYPKRYAKIRNRFCEIFLNSQILSKRYF